MEFPVCQKCVANSEGHEELATMPRLVPLSDFATESTVHYKAWACTNLACGFVLRIDKGEVSYTTRRAGQL